MTVFGAGNRISPTDGSLRPDPGTHKNAPPSGGVSYLAVTNEKKSSVELSFFMGLKIPNKLPPFSQNLFTNLQIYGILILNEIIS